MSKKLLLAVFLLFPLFSFAGSFNLSLGGGLIPKSGEYPEWVTRDSYPLPLTNEPKKVNGLLGAIKLAYTFKRFEFGAGLEIGSMQRNGNITQYPMHWGPHDNDKAFYYSKFYGANLFGNINFPLTGKFNLYTGFTAGVLFATSVINHSDYNNGYGTFLIMEEAPYSYMNGESSGWAYATEPKNLFTGIQVGARYQFSSRFSAYGEIAPRMAFEIGNSAPGYSYNLFYSPMTLGVSCRVSKHS